MIQAVNKHQALLRASIASAGQDHRLGANEAPPAIISIFLGAELREGVRGDRDGQGAAPRSPARSSASARRCCRRCRCTAATATARARSRSPATSSSSARSARAHRRRCPTRSSTRSSPSRSTSWPSKLKTALKRSGATLEKAVAKVVKESWAANKQIVFDGDNYTEEWHKEAEKRGPGEPAHDARRAAVADRETDGRAVQEVQGAVQARARVALGGVHRAVRGERSTSRPRPRRRSRARCCCRRPCAT